MTPGHWLDAAALLAPTIGRVEFTCSAVYSGIPHFRIWIPGVAMETVEPPWQGLTWELHDAACPWSRANRYTWLELAIVTALLAAWLAKAAALMASIPELPPIRAQNSGYTMRQLDEMVRLAER
jgi:hypothetical protein